MKAKDVEISLIKVFMGVVGIWIGFLIVLIGGALNSSNNTINALFNTSGMLISFVSSLYIMYVVSVIVDLLKSKKETTTNPNANQS